jgi:hypothetical protein
LFRRGFKAQCERRSLEIRKTLRIESIGRLDAIRLGLHLGVAIWSASEIPDWPDKDRHHLLKVASDEWSAFVLREDHNYLVVYNPMQAAARINSVLMHELSHIMLGHELATASTTADGHFLNGNYDEAQEREADWLGGTLLLPRPALLWAAHRKVSLSAGPSALSS